MRDPYEILDLSPDATEADIKKAFREKAKQYHPDRHPGNERVAEVFKEINAAYQLLNSKNRARTDFERRRRAASQEQTKPQNHTRTAKDRAAGMAGEQFHEYYEQAAKRAEDKAPGSAADDKDNLYKENFANHDFTENEERASQADNIFGGDSGQWFQSDAKAADNETNSNEGSASTGRSFSDFLSRVTDRGKDIFSSRPKPNARPEIGREPNRRSNGRGQDVQYSLTIPFIDAALGSRHRVTLPMETGNGKTLDIAIPAGVRDGQQMRLKGQGANGNPPGDALIDISVEDHDHFMRDGLDLFIDIPVTLDEAMLGSDIRVPTIHGAVTVKVPPGSDSGQTLRLRGKGIVRTEKNGKKISGDQYLTLTVKMPPNPGPLLRRAVEEEARNSPYGVRHALKDLL